MLDPREDVLRRKEQTKRTQRMIGTCKGKFTKEIKTFIQNAEYFLSKDTGHSVDGIDLPGSGLMIDCANAFLGSLNRVIDRYIVLEKFEEVNYCSKIDLDCQVTNNTVSITGDPAEVHKSAGLREKP